MKNIEELHKLCEKAMETITEANRKLDREEGKLTHDDAAFLDHLAHMVKSIKTIEAMEGYYDDYSGDSGWNYNKPYSYSGARRMRDSIGRYTSRDGYSRDASRQKMVDKLYTLLDDTMSDGERHAINECIEKIR